MTRQDRPQAARTMLRRCGVCKVWVVEKGVPREGYVCSACAAQGQGVARRQRLLESEIAALEHEIARMRAQEAEHGTPG
jgi:hypothetical protein